MENTFEPMSEAVQRAYEKALGLDKWKPEKVKKLSFAQRHPELYDRKLVTQLRADLIFIYGERCMACGESGKRIVLEHIRSRRFGGTNETNNLQLLCDRCNIAKGHKEIDYRPANT